MDSGGSRGSGASTLQTVERALSFLEVVAKSPTSLTVKEVASRLEVNITTCYHLFNTLVARGYIERNPDQTLRVGFQAAVLYDGYQRGFSTQEQMNEFVSRLARATSETAWISMLVNDSVVLTAFEDGPQAVRATGLYIGLSGLEHVRSSGRAVLAFLDDERRERILEKSLAGVAPSRQPEIRNALAAELSEVRARGWAFDDQDYNIGIIGIAAPFFTLQGEVIGAVGVWAPVPRGYDMRDDLVDKVNFAAREATDAFGRQH